MPLIVFEGIDGSGKSTQFRRLAAHMDQAGAPYSRLVFPQYDKPSSALLRMYLDGAFGADPDAVNPYAASTFYAVDRYASYNRVWGDAYKSGATILADRYTTSNIVHQGAKIPAADRLQFFRWLDEFEHDLMELPRPDLVLYMDIPTEIALENMRTRQIETNTQADIHEAGEAYLRRCCETARAATDFFGWHPIPCAANGVMRPEEEIHREILNILSSGYDR